MLAQSLAYYCIWGRGVYLHAKGWRRGTIGRFQSGTQGDSKELAPQPDSNPGCERVVCNIGRSACSRWTLLCTMPTWPQVSSQKSPRARVISNGLRKKHLAELDLRTCLYSLSFCSHSISLATSRCRRPRVQLYVVEPQLSQSPALLGASSTTYYGPWKCRSGPKLRTAVE